MCRSWSGSRCCSRPAGCSSPTFAKHVAVELSAATVERCSGFPQGLRACLSFSYRSSGLRLQSHGLLLSCRRTNHRVERSGPGNSVADWFGGCDRIRQGPCRPCVQECGSLPLTVGRLTSSYSIKLIRWVLSNSFAGTCPFLDSKHTRVRPIARSNRYRRNFHRLCNPGRWQAPGAQTVFNTAATPSQSVLDGLKVIGEGQMLHVRHGTTVGTNTMLERDRGPRGVRHNS